MVTVLSIFNMVIKRNHYGITVTRLTGDLVSSLRTQNRIEDTRKVIKGNRQVVVVHYFKT